MLVTANTEGLVLGTDSSACATTPHAQRTEATLAMLSRVKPATPRPRAFSITAPISTTTSATLLCQVLVHHSSSLTSLTLTCLPSPKDGPLIPATTISAIARLTRLSHLAIAFDGPLHPDGPTAAATIAALAATISALPALADFRLLDINTLTPEAALEQQGRKRKAGCLGAVVEPPSLDPVIAALATSPALTSLTLSRSECKNSTPPPCHGVRGAFSALKELHIGVDTPSSTQHAQHTPLWLPTCTSTPLPSGPLPALTALSFYCGDEILEEVEMVDIVRSTQHAQQLRAVSLDVSGLRSDALQAFRTKMPAPLQRIETFSLSVHAVDSMEEARGVGVAVAPLTALTSLHVCVKRFDGEGRMGQLNGGPGAEDMLSPLSSLQRLQNLSISLFEDDQAPAGAEAIAGAPLATLTTLTALSIATGGHIVPASTLSGRVNSLRGFRTLSLEGVSVEPFFEISACMACIAPLTALTALTLGVDEVSYWLVQAIGEWVATAQELQRVRVRGCEDYIDEEAETDAEQEHPMGFFGLLHVPARGRYELDVRSEFMPSVKVGRVTRQLEARGAVVGGDFRTIQF